MSATNQKIVVGAFLERFAVVMLVALAVAGCVASPSQPTGVPATAAATVAATNAPTLAPTVVPSAQPTPIPSATPTVTPTPAPSPTPAPNLVRITDGKCCTQPFWSPDSKQVLFIDKPDPSAPTGIYAVDVDAPAAPRLLTERIAFYTSDMQYAQTIDGAFAVITRLSDGQQYRIRTGGRTVLLSPDRTRVLWSVTPQSGAFENRTTVVMGANIDGSEARPVVSLLRAGVNAWLDNQHLLMTARLNRNSQEVTLFIYSLVDGSQQELVKSEHLRTVSLSPGAEWIAYTIVFDQSAEQNGMWLMRADGSEKKRLDIFGSFQWRDGHRFIYVPLELSRPDHVFYEYDATTGNMRSLTGGLQPVRIGNGDWTVSPDGRRIVFLSADDLNLWVWNLGS